MTLDDYASVGGGALRLKGAKVSKPKKKKKKDKAKDKPSTSRELVKVSSPSASDQDVVEKRKRKKDDGDEIEEEDREPVVQKTETQLRHEEMKRKRLLELAEKPGAKPELLKTHKERVEELNTFLSKLSEHNDMPKIGPG